MSTSPGNLQSSGLVQLQDKTIVHIGFASSVRTAGIRINTNGTVQWLKTYQFLELQPLTDWIIPNQSGAAYEVRITNLVWITMDEGFIISPSGSDNWTVDPLDLGSDGDPNGDEDVWFDLSQSREWVFVDHEGTAGVGLQHATFDMEIRLGAVTLATAQMDWVVDSAPSGGGGGGGGCFVHGTEMRMADDSLKEIQDIKIGDVMKSGGRVKATQIGDATKETWFDIDGVIVTGTHGYNKKGIWMRVEDAGYPIAEEQPDTFYVVSNQYHRMRAANGHLFTDYQEVDYMSSGWDDWVMSNLNGDSDVDVLRNAIISTGLESKRAKDFLAKEGIYEEDYMTQKNNLLIELEKLERAKKIKHPVTGRPLLQNLDDEDADTDSTPDPE